LGIDFNHYAASVKPYLTSAQIKLLIENGFDIGGHSIDHPLYSELSIEEQLTQTLESMRLLSERYQYDCRVFAFPFTDAGISGAFFERTFRESPIKLSFGTGGVLPHFFGYNLPRFTMERCDRPAGEIVGRQFGRAFIQKFLVGIKP
jgi:hypothetical protein